MLHHKDPATCTDVAELQAWVRHLQELHSIMQEQVYACRKMAESSEKMSAIAYRQCVILEELNGHLSDKVEILLDRIDEYKSSFSTKHINNPSRLN